MSVSTLNEMGRFTNGVVTSGAMLLVMQPVDTLQTYVMARKGMPPRNALYRGLIPNTAAVAPVNGVAFVANGLFCRFFGPDCMLIASILSGMTGAPFATAFERVKIVQQLEKIAVREAVKKIYAQEGARGFLKGFTPTAVREAMFTCSLFYLKDGIDKQLQRFVTTKEPREAAASFAAGALAGFASTSAARIKTEMQADFHGSTSVVQTAARIVKAESLRGLFFKGALPRSGYVAGALCCIGYTKEIFPAWYPSWMHQHKEAV